MEHVARDPLTIVEIERFSVRPGDILFVHVHGRVRPEDALRMRDYLTTYLERYEIHLPVLVLEEGVTVSAGHIEKTDEDRSSE